MTDDFGQFDLEITPRLVEEQQLESYEGWNGIAYSVIPYSSDIVAFIPGRRSNGETCAALLDTTMPGQVGTTFGRHLDNRMCSTRNWEDPANGASTLPTGTQPRLPDSADVADAALFDELTKFAAADFRARVTTKQVEHGSASSTMIRGYRWKWPADALVARAHGLLDTVVKFEESYESLLSLQRSQIGAAFSKMCVEASDAPVADAFLVSRLLWWAEAQTKGIGEANQHARDRSELYENGKRCFSSNGRQPQVRPGRKALTKAETCAMWQAVGMSLENPPYEPPASFAHLKYDVQCRRGD